MTVWHEEERQVAMIEYVQANELVRHYDTVDWIVGSIFIPISITLLGVSFTEPILEQGLGVALALSISSIGMYLVWLLLDWRYSFFCQVAYERIHKIEERFGMDTHRRINRKDREQSARSIRRAHFWIRLFFFVIFAVWIARIVLSL